jgi:hypothetical protein
MATVNRLLSALPVRDRRRIVAACEPVELCALEQLGAFGAPMRALYFPTGAHLSLRMPPGSGSAGFEVLQVGHEGMVGTAALLGVATFGLQHCVHGGGSALRMSAATLRRELGPGSALRLRLSRYAHVVMYQMAQNAGCARFHRVEQRLSRWLLSARDRSETDELFATHGALAGLLGVRRVGVTRAATALQNQGLIRYRRGAITICERAGLLTRSCACYVASVEYYARVLG